MGLSDPNLGDGAELEGLIETIRMVVFDFDGVFTDNMVYVSADGTEFVRCWRGDGLGLRKLDRLGVATCILSTEADRVVSVRARKLGIRCMQAVENKRAALEAISREAGIRLGEVAYLGNDINDLPCLTLVGLPIAVSDAHPDVLAAVRFRTAARGGHGAVRELCDLFERVHERRSLQRT